MPRIFFLACLCACLILPGALFAMQPMQEAEMDQVQGQSGIALAVGEARIYKHEGHLAYEDTIGNGQSMELSDIYYTDGDGGPMRFHSAQPATFTVYTDGQERPVVSWQNPDWEQDVYVDVGTFTFCGQDLGSLHVHGLEPRETALHATPLQDDQGTGIGFELEARADLQELRWVYNQNDEQASLGDVQVAGYFEQDGDDPADPDTWQPRERFTVGDLNLDGESEYTPASMQMLQDDQDRPFMRLDLPEMSGSIRVADVEMAGNDLGPIILDGIQVHHLQVDFVPFDQ